MVGQLQAALRAHAGALEARDPVELERHNAALAQALERLRGQLRATDPAQRSAMRASLEAMRRAVTAHQHLVLRAAEANRTAMAALGLPVGAAAGAGNRALRAAYSLD